MPRTPDKTCNEWRSRHALVDLDEIVEEEEPVVEKRGVKSDRNHLQEENEEGNALMGSSS